MDLGFGVCFSPCNMSFKKESSWFKTNTDQNIEHSRLINHQIQDEELFLSESLDLSHRLQLPHDTNNSNLNSSIAEPTGFDFRSGCRGVSWNRRMRSWLAFWTENKIRRSKTFNAKVLGFENAREQAILFLKNKKIQLRQQSNYKEEYIDQTITENDFSNENECLPFSWNLQNHHN
jgi:AP2 domain